MSNTATTSAVGTHDTGWRQDLRSPLTLGLLLVLGLQLLIALGLSLSNPGLSALTPQSPLVAVTPADVTRVVIEGAASEPKVELSRQQDDQWVIADMGDLPVTAGKVDQLIEAVAALKRPLPVGATEAARARFKVADEAFVRRLTLEDAAGRKTILLLGETPSFRRLFGRPADDGAVYDLPLALSDISNRRDDWTRADLLKIDQEQIASIHGQDWTLTKTDSGWSLKDAEAALDEQAAEELAMKLSGLSYRGVLGIEDDPAYKQEAPALELSLALDDGTTRTYRISQADASEDYVLKSDAQPYYFKLSKYDLEGLLDLDRSKLIAQPEAPSDGAGADTTEATPAPDETAAEQPADAQRDESLPVEAQPQPAPPEGDQAPLSMPAEQAPEAR